MDRVHASLRCQNCNVRLVVTGLDAISKENPAERGVAARSFLGQSTFGGQKIDDSFIVLDPSKQPRSHQQGPLDDSFLMVGGTASLLRHGGTPAMQASSQGIPLQNVDDTFQQLAQIFEIASGQAEIDQPLCPECALRVREDVEASIADLEAECEAYSATLEELERENAAPMPKKMFEAELRAAEAELRDEEAKARQADAELLEAEAQLGELRCQAGELESLEAGCWHAVNHLDLALLSHARRRTSLERKIHRSEEQLKRLQTTNAYNDVFKIWYEGDLPTISGFRLGRLPDCNVEWDEMNAALGQAVLLLHTMAQACQMTFSGHRLLPMGSYSRIVDNKKGAMELFGPVTKLYCSSFDRAMVSYLACLKEFYEFAQGRDQAHGRTPVEMVYAIEGEAVGGLSIKYFMCKDAVWTRALKLMFANLKWALAWMTAGQSGKALT